MKTEMKCRMLRHFIISSLFTEKGIKVFGKSITCDPSIYIMGHPGLTVLNFTEGKFHGLEGLIRSKNSALMDIYTVNPGLLAFFIFIRTTHQMQ